MLNPESSKVHTEPNNLQLTCPPWPGRSDCVIAVELCLPAEFVRHLPSIERLEVSLGELPGVLAAQLDLVWRVLRIEVVCGTVSPGALISALYQALRPPQN